MRLTTVILIASLIQVSAATFGQRITMNHQNTSLSLILKEIRQQSGYDIFYDGNAIAKDQKVSVTLSNADINEALKIALKGLDLTFEVKEKNVTIKKKEPTFLERLAERWASIDVSGRVVDADGRGLPGASVSVKGKGGKAVSTGANGNFYLKGVDEDAVLVVSFIGYVPKEVKAAKELGDVVLEVSLSKLDEVQVIAYGTTTQRLSTGNVTTIKADVIEKQPVNNPLLALQGRVPGLFIEQATGFAGTGVKVRIQGTNSLYNGNDPLYVIDGVPFLSQLAPIADYIPDLKGNSGGGRTNGSALNFINPADIESIDVLKDADATAIYGSRAANGAILITTKRGKSGEMRVGINAQTGIGQVPKKIDMLNTTQYLAMRNEALKNDQIASPAYYEYDINGAWGVNRDIDWQDELIGGNAQYHDIQTSVSGGGTNNSYLISSGYHRETNVFPGEFADTKASLHASINSTSDNQKFRMQFSGSYLADVNRLPTVDLTQIAVTLPPNAPDPYNSDGSLNWMPNQSGTSTYPNNPLAAFKNSYKNKTNTLTSNASLSYSILKGLEIKSSFGFTSLNSDQEVLYPTSSQKPENLVYVKGASSFSNNTSNSWIIEPQITFNRIISQGKFEFLLGSTLQKTTSNDGATFGSNYISDLLIGDIKSAPDVIITQSNNTIYRYNALYGRLNYNWKNKYIINLTARRDGSSNFGPESQFHNFGSIAGAWIFSESKLIKDKFSTLSQGKLRLSYGTTGSDQIGSYQFLDLYESIPVGVPYQGGLGLKSNRLNNPYLQWEETKKFQVGLDLGFFKDNILVNINYNRNRSSNQLTSIPLPIITGSYGIPFNLPAIVQNTGWEISLNTNNIRSKNFRWSSGFNITVPRNKLVSFTGAEFQSNNGFVLGRPVSIGHVYRYAGVNENTGLYQFTDNQGNITSTPSNPIDKTILINTDPKFYGGFQNTIAYKAFSVDLLFQFVKQTGTDWTQLGSTTTAGKLFSNVPISLLDRWQKPGDHTSHQMFSIRKGSNAAAYAAQSDVMYTDASYIRLKNISISWGLPDKWKKKLHAKGLDLFLRGQNILTITNYQGLDPETKVLGLPPLRTMTIGAKLTL